ncbi:hypothetical protein SDC9_64269 [bioreactor metagenome]|uniref:Uncharacterized protein n=1 Tax=bioreactor metagenome TaxID=1076179 RepID=A0A644XP01_9ZZZZ
MLQTDKDSDPEKLFHLLDCTGHDCGPPVPLSQPAPQPEPPKPQHGHHALSAEACRFLLLRNCAVVLAAVLFCLSLFFVAAWQDLSFRLKAVAYFAGAAAYGCEYLMLTDCGRHRPGHREMLMSGVFGIMYIILGISYFNH